MFDLQIYSEKAIVEAEGPEVILTTLTKVDLSEIAGQLNIDDVLDNYDYSDIADYMVRRKEKDEV
jgi:hypothetical protein